LRNSIFARLSTWRLSALKPRPPRLIWKFNMDIADWNGLVFRRRLASADRFNDLAMLRALRNLNTPGCRSKALLFFDTSLDQRRPLRAAPADLRAGADLCLA
jgi:hypothetical protein